MSVQQSSDAPASIEIDTETATPDEGSLEGIAPDKCPSCGGYTTVKRALGTFLEPEVSDHKRRLTKYAFESMDVSKDDLCPSCKAALEEE